MAKKKPQHGLVVTDDLPETHFPFQFCRPQDRNLMETDPRKRLKGINERDGLEKETTLPMQKLVFRCETRCRWEKCGLRRGQNDGDGDSGNPCANVRGVLRMEEGRNGKSEVERRRGNYYLFRNGRAAADCGSLIKPYSLVGGFLLHINYSKVQKAREGTVVRIC